MSRLTVDGVAIPREVEDAERETPGAIANYIAAQQAAQPTDTPEG